MEMIEGVLDMGKRGFLMHRPHIHGYRNDRLPARLIQADVKTSETALSQLITKASNSTCTDCSDQPKEQ
ncbi:hypothetical protein [Marinobacter sp. AN1]|uniref:hypothetical protein n=1 Tax=Marinobacter sp. AN1 TaxID=2886046 RepID=UPI0022307DA4|nr:hypothetical protein [Marinobacter sp. AN1]UZD66478.1 hypothetical protein LJ360_03750 [Marinobacter sp. AN1]